MRDVIIRQATLKDLKSIQNLNYELFKLEKENYDSTLIVDWPLSEEGKNGGIFKGKSWKVVIISS